MTTNKQMRAYLTRLQIWQRKVVTKKMVDYYLELMFTDKNIQARVVIWQRGKDGELKRDEQGDLIGSSFDIYQHRGESENNAQMDAIERLLNDLNAI